MKKDSKIFISHILSCIEDIERYSLGLKKPNFKREDIIQNAIIRKIEVIGEACKNMPKPFRSKHPQVPWAKIIGTRNKLIHQYFGVDLDLIWDVVKIELPILKQQFGKILESKDI